jgi:hypothetical protein
MALCIMIMGILFLDFMLSFAFVGDRPLLKRLIATMSGPVRKRNELVPVPIELTTV